eukprot:7325922-Pyramimonas_sp.AAC.1
MKVEHTETHAKRIVRWAGHPVGLLKALQKRSIHLVEVQGDFIIVDTTELPRARGRQEVAQGYARLCRIVQGSTRLIEDMRGYARLKKVTDVALGYAGLRRGYDRLNKGMRCWARFCNSVGPGCARLDNAVQGSSELCKVNTGSA